MFAKLFYIEKKERAKRINEALGYMGLSDRSGRENQEVYRGSSKVAEVVQFFEERRFNKAIETLEKFYFDTHNYQAFPKEHLRKIRNTNILERINKELKRRSRSLGHSLMMSRY